MGVETTLYLSPNTFVEPDLVVYPRGLRLEDVKGTDILLAIEVAATSLAYDRGLKAQLYARHGVNELWVVDAARRTTFVHQRTGGERMALDRRARARGGARLRGLARVFHPARDRLARPVAVPSFSPVLSRPSARGPNDVPILSEIRMRRPIASSGSAN